MVSTPSLKSILIKPANVHVLSSLEDELVYACHAKGGGGVGGWSSVLLPRQHLLPRLTSSHFISLHLPIMCMQVVLPRQHSCFYREEHASELMDGRGNRTAVPIAPLNYMHGRMAGKGEAHMTTQESSLLMGFVTNRATCRGPSYKHAATKTHDISAASSFPLDNAVWARVDRSPLLAKCGVRLAIQRVERANARGRRAMQNQLATFLMLETESGIAPPSWQHGIGDTYIYKCPGAEEGMGNLEHLHMDELGFIWEFINGELGCGEHVSNASAAKYRSQLARYRIRNQRER